MVIHGCGLVPRPGHSSRNPSTPKISLGKLGGIRSPPGLDTQNSTRQDRKALRGQTDRTGQPTGTGSPPGLARKLRLPLGMTSQGPSQGPSVTAFISATSQVKSSHLYLYSAFNNTNCDKATAQYQNGKIVSIM